MPGYLKILLLFALAGMGISCSMLGINTGRKTPARAYRLPLFTEKDSLKGAAGPYRVNNDVVFYELDVDLDPETRSLKGQVDILFRALREMDTLQVDLSSRLPVERISRGNSVLGFRRLHDAIFIGLGDKLFAGDTASIRIQYSGQPVIAPRPPWDGGMVWKKDKYGRPWLGVTCELTGSSIWWPSKDQLVDEPDSMIIHITVPDGLFGVSNGHLVKREKTGEKERFTYRVTYPINAYNVSFYAGDFVQFSIPFQETATPFLMDFYVLPENLEKARTHFLQTIDILSFFEKTFGAYPWPRDGFKLVESPYAGMEHQTAIAYGNSFRNGHMGYDIDYIMLHEIAHEWWGNAVSASDFSDIWLQEGFATYAEALYVEARYGKKSYRQYLLTYSMFIRNRKPLIGPRNVNYWHYKDTDPYMKGALTLHTLRGLIDNDSLFFAVIRTFYEENRYKNIDSQVFIDLVNRMTHQDYSWFFSQYLYDRRVPVLEYDIAYQPATQTYTLFYRWNQTLPGFRLPVTVSVGGNDIRINPRQGVGGYSLGSTDTCLFHPDEGYYAVKKNKRLSKLLP